jgi:predicted TIM-barrel fold metal-dependent hydrolase
MAYNGFKVFDSDMHVLEPADLWVRYIDPKYKDRAPVGTNEYLGDLHLLHDGEVISRSKKMLVEDDIAIKQCERFDRVETFADFQERGWGSDVQVEAMDAEGIDVAVMYPTRGLVVHAKEYDDDGLAGAISRAYNDWLVEFCAIAPDRMYGAAMLPAQSVEAAVAEARRAKEELGFKAVFLRPNPIRGRNWNNPAYDPLWAECEKQGLAVGFHEGMPCVLPVAIGDRFDGIHEDFWLTEHVACHPIEQMYACLSMIAGGVCERFPALRVAFLEGNCSWLPFWLWRLDEHYETREHKLKKSLPLRPSEYFKRQCFAGVEADEDMARYVFDWMGDSYFVFSTDFPHHDCRYPHATETLLEQPFSEESKRKILWDNCNRLYAFD